MLPYRRMRCGWAVARMGYATLTVTTGDWRFRAQVRPVFDHVSGVRRRLDLQTSRRPSAAPHAPHEPHGLLGQGFRAGTTPLHGREDVYPSAGEMTTSAMAEGAIDGVAADYVVAGAHAVDFRYSRFRDAPRSGVN